MSDGSIGGQRDDPALQTAQAESEIARAEADVQSGGQQKAEKVRDTVLDGAVSQAAHKDAAELVMRNEAYFKHQLEVATDNAKIRAGQARPGVSGSSAEGSVLRAHLASERKVASKVTFGLVIAFILVAIGLVAGGIYYFSSQNSAGIGASTGAAP